MSDSIKKRKDEKIEKILDAALQVFAEYGFKGARAESIASRAGINKQTIYYYIGDKETLYERVVSEYLGRMLKDFQFKIDKNLSPEQNLKEFIGAIVRNVNKYHYLHAIILQEQGSRGDLIPKDVALGIGQLAETFQNIISPGVKQGTFVEEDPLIMFILVFGFSVLWHYNEDYLKKDNICGDTIKAMGKDDHSGLIHKIQEIGLKILKP